MEDDIITINSLPQKKFYRQRAHVNPISDHVLEYPLHPNDYDWTKLFPSIKSSEKVQFLDVGCGYGGLLFHLGEEYPEKYSLGLEIRIKVCDYVQDKIKVLRRQRNEIITTTTEKIRKFNTDYENIACIRCNAMKHLTNFFYKSQLEKIFFLYPDPHFKKEKHKWRIISEKSLNEFSFILKNGGRIYIVTDVKDLYEWMTKHFNDHPSFSVIDDLKDDKLSKYLLNVTEEGKKVERNSGEHFMAAYEKIK
ncbi:hypothetical protein SNEBB_008940 [Seison nebaliae]|nr:hypothetical protein SNEBB_008940 [Seison nebaliae]